MKVSLKLVWLLAVVSLVSLSSSEFATGAELEYITIYKAEPGRSAMYSIFAPLKDGTLLCAFRDSELDLKGEWGNKKKGSPWMVPGSRIMCIRSNDNGRTWSKTPTLIYQDKDNFAYSASCGNGYLAKDGSVLFPISINNAVANSETDDPAGRQAYFLARSRDNGHTWTYECTRPHLLNSTVQYGSIVQVNDGSLWMLELRLYYQIDKRGNKTRGNVSIIESTDDGKSWSHYCYVGYDPTRPKETESMPVATSELDEPAIIQLPSGKVLIMFRPLMLQGVSLDRGHTWKIGPSTLSRGGISGLCPSMSYTKAGPPTGTIVLAYHDRWGEHAKKGGNYISFSHDEGDTWGYPTWIGSYAYPCLYELEKDSGKFLCGYYRHKSLLKGVFFSVPFPTGLRAEPGLENSEQLGITVKWDEYNGKGSDEYEYRLYRSTKAGASLEQSKLVFSGKDICSYADEAVEKEQTYYYRVAAFRDGKVVNKSWQDSAKSGI